MVFGLRWAARKSRGRLASRLLSPYFLSARETRPHRLLVSFLQSTTVYFHRPRIELFFTAGTINAKNIWKKTFGEGAKEDLPGSTTAIATKEKKPKKTLFGKVAKKPSTEATTAETGELEKAKSPSKGVDESLPEGRSVVAHGRV